MTPEKRLWQTVVLRAVIDGLSDKKSGDTTERAARREADAWIRAAGSDFREVCSLAGFDPQFLRDAYQAGKIDIKALQSFERYKSERAA